MTRVSICGLLGPVILLAVAGTWVLLHLCGYVLILRGGLSLVQADTGEPATWVQTVTFAGSTLSTLGASTVQVTGGWWDILSMVAAMNGMILLTLAVSFLLNIPQTTNSARTFASRFHAVKAREPDGDNEWKVLCVGRIRRRGSAEGCEVRGHAKLPQNHFQSAWVTDMHRACQPFSASTVCGW